MIEKTRANEGALIMHQVLKNGLIMVEEADASAEVAALYDDIKRTMQTPSIPNGAKAIAVSPAALTIFWNMLRSFYQHLTLPQSLVSMILFTIAEKNHCKYCSATNELTCRTLGVDEETLSVLVNDLGSVSPERLQAIIEFAVKVAKFPQSLEARDYDKVRNQGVSDAELVEIILVAATGNYNDTLADALKIEVEMPVAEALGRAHSL
jgi:uncharacterized peroxidase-related enzyme